MSSRHSNSLFILSLMVGAALPWVVIPSALAGDKIDFSAPAAPLPVPQLEQDTKETEPDHATSMLHDVQPASELDDSFLPPATETVIVAAPKKKNSRGWGSDSNDARNNGLDTEDRDDSPNSDPYATRQPFAATTTNRWDMERGWTPSPISPFQRNEDGERSDSYRSRMDSFNNSDNRNSLEESRFGASSTGFDNDSAWSHSAMRHAFPSLERMRTGQFVPFDSDTKTASDPHVDDSALRSSNPLEGQPDYTPPGMTEYKSQVDTLRGKDPEANLVAPRVFRPVEPTLGSLNYGTYSQAEPTPESRNLAPVRPGILPFPKKPGSLFQ